MKTKHLRNSMLDLLEKDLEKISNHSYKEPKSNQLFKNFNKNFKSRLEDNEDYIDNIKKSINNTKR